MPDGVATLRVDAGGNLAVRVDAYGLAPGSAATLAVVEGSCLQPGATLLSFAQPLTANAQGVVVAEVTSEQAAAAGIPHGAAVTLRDTGAALLACTDVPASNAGAPLRLFAPPADKPGATVMLSPSGGTDVSVSIAAVDLHPDTSYAVELRSGSCQAPGALLRTITSGLASNARGSAQAGTTLGGLSAPGPKGWYLVVVGSGGGAAVLCGNVPR
jgi:hypothetical protein